MRTRASGGEVTVQVTDIQAQTISTEAVSHLRLNDPVQIPGDRLTQEFAHALNEQIEAQTGPFLEQLRASLRLRVEHETAGGTRVVVITPHAVKPNRAERRESSPMAAGSRC